ncbi:MAG: hypothetical protein RI907_1982 [Pseudomonadota bacterium]|jgi:predicted esterase YcpF (UPF0227 family)
MRTSAPTHLIYLHGFRSSPRSFKARQLAEAVSALPEGMRPVWACPQLPPSPAAAWRTIDELTRDWPAESMAVVGSSLGGFYATVLAERRGCRAAVINPAVAPARDLAAYIGEQHTYDDPADRFFVQPGFMAEFEALAPYPITRPERYWALVAQGDEVLDWREMAAAYAGTQLSILPGGDHAVSDFAQHQPALMRWLGWGV